MVNVQKIENRMPLIEKEGEAITERYLGAQPVVQISWNERQLGEISLKQCEVALNSIAATDFEGSSKKLTPNTNSIISTLHPRIRNSGLKKSKKDDNKMNDRDDTKTKQKQSCPDNQLEVSNKKPTPKKGYIIETIDASGNVVMKNGKPLTNAMETENSTSFSGSKRSRKTSPINDSSTNEKGTPISSEKAVRQSSFGRNIRRSNNQSDFSYDTPSGNKRGKYIMLV